MSSLYNLEPQPTAKCILHTTSGDILLELFGQQTPLTTRNFLQHCLNGYYDNTIFHRLVPGFIIQGGDPTGTGAGGESSYGKPFEDEFHSRLKFNRRGLLGMANTGKDDNGSQFFLTLGKTAELENKHTMFGRVEGDTIYNLVKMGETDLTEEEGSERPMYPTKITGTEVLVNPFEDMVKRVQLPQGRADQKVEKKKGGRKKATKGLLSFGGDEAEGEDVAPVVKAKFNAKLVDGGDAELAARPIKRPAPDTGNDRPRKRRATPTPSPSPPPAARPAESRVSKQASRSASPSISPEPEPEVKAPSALERTNAQIAELKKSLQRNVVTAPAENKRHKSALEAMIPATATRGRRRKPAASGSGSAVSKEEQRALDNFNEFRKRLEAAPAAAPASNGAKVNAGYDGSREDQEEPNTTADDADEEGNLCDLHFVLNCQSCRKWDQEDAGNADNSDDDGDPAWMSHRLTFEKDRLGKDLEWKRQMEKELVVIDPREREKELVAEKRKGREKMKR